MKEEKKEEKPGEKIEIMGHKLVCPICLGDHFTSRQAQLNTSAATFFGLDWANRSAKCYVCVDCTYIYWFLV